MNFKSGSVIFLTFFAFLGYAQQSSFKPLTLGEGVNSEYHEINPVMHPNGKLLFFTRQDHPENNFGKHGSQDVWYSELGNDGKWGPAKRLKNFVNGSRYNAVIGIFEDGKTILISGVYRGKKYLKPGLSITTKLNDNWSNPVALKIKGFRSSTLSNRFNASLSPDGQAIFLAFSRIKIKKKLDIYVTTMKNDLKWNKLKPLDSKINTNNSEEAPFLMPDNETLYFSSKRGDSKGFDIYMCKRNGKDWDDWTEPTLAEANVNTEGYESFFKSNRKGTEGYFVSSTSSYGGADIYKIKLKEEQPFVVVSGKIINKKTSLPLSHKEFSVLVNNRKADSTKTDSVSAQYTVKLPFGKAYQLSGKVMNFVPIPDTVDATNVKEFTEITKDLYMQPLAYVKVQGRFVDKNTGFSIPPASNPKLFVDSDPSDDKVERSPYSDSAKINKSNATYAVNLPYGKKYVLQLEAGNYKGLPDTLDLSHVEEYQEIERPLYGEREKELVFEKPVATITGVVMNKKTFKPVGASVNYFVQVDKIQNPNVILSFDKSEYTLLVPFGTSYVINARADKFYPIFENVDLSKELKPIKVVRNLSIVPLIVGQAVRMNNIVFQTGKAVLDPKSFPELNKLVTFLKENPTIRVEISGHTDNVGKPAKNLQLSRWRARAVEQYLENKGVPLDQVTFNGYGMTKPLTSNKSAWGKSQNRRVEFVIKGVD